MAKRRRFITETMDEKAEEAYALCLNLLESLYAGEKVTQAVLLDAVIKAWKIHNRFVSLIRHNLRLDYSDSSLWGVDISLRADPNNIHKILGGPNTDSFTYEKNTSLIGLARELLMEVVDYPTRKIIEHWKTKEVVQKEFGSLLYDLKEEIKYQEEDDSNYHPDYQKEPLDEDSYVKGLKYALESTKSYNKGTYSNRSYASIASIYDDIDRAHFSYKRRVERENEYHQEVLKQRKQYTVKLLAELHGVNVSTARRWCTKGQIKARQVGEYWLVDEDVAKAFIPPKAGRPRKEK